MKPVRLRFLNKISAGQRILIVVAIVMAIPAFIFVRNLVLCWSITRLPGVAPASCGVGNSIQEPQITGDRQGNQATLPNTSSVDVAAPEASLPSWDGSSRVTLLFIGLDERDWEVGAGAPRSDTMILFTIDPASKTAGMLSIPRDLWVNIPGFWYSKINTAYAYGEASKLPGGGPGLAVKTVEQFIGVPIQYYAQVDFNAFEEAIDAMGGLYLCPGERITIDPIGPKPPVKMGPECRKYWGYEVLGYVRNRHTSGGDIDRANRQQKVIMALLEQVFSPQNFPAMAAKAPDIYLEARLGLRTNLGFDNALRLGALLSQIPEENIKRGVIDYSMAVLDSVKVGDGPKASILKPFPDQIRLLRDEIFSVDGALGPLAGSDPLELMQEDAARVRVLNGTTTSGLSERIGSYLQAEGMQVVDMGGDASRRYDHTIVVLYGPKLYTLQYLVALFGIDSPNQILFNPDLASPVDIEIRLGADALNLIQ
jgi:polyisoprenyl-teichoic acid--peptidoglycan teichoic acid transferase